MTREEQIEQAKHIRAVLDGTAEAGSKFTITIEAAKSGGLFATSNDMRGLLTFGPTIDKLMPSTAAALELLVQAVLEQNCTKEPGVPDASA